MTMTSDDPWQLIGTVQCFVSVSTYTVFSADVHVVYKGKPNPPTRIEGLVRLDFFTRQYQLYASDYASNSRCRVQRFFVEYIVARNSNTYNACTCNRPGLDFECSKSMKINTAPWVTTYNKKLYIRVATVMDGVRSDFYQYRPDGTTCYEDLYLDRNPPAPKLDDPVLSLSSTSSMWNITQCWRSGDCKYPSEQVHYDVAVECLDPESPVNKKYTSNNREYYTFVAACLTECNITVTSQVDGRSPNSSTAVISTGSQYVPPEIILAQRIDESSFDVTISLLGSAVSCLPPFIAINLSNTSSSMQLIDISSCHNESSGSPSDQRYVCRVHDSDSCWNDYQLSVAYANDFGDKKIYSQFSNNTWDLPGVNDDDLLRRIASVENFTPSEDTILLNLTINTSLACYAGSRDLQICRTAPALGSCDYTPFNASSSVCLDLHVDEPSQNVSFFDLSAGSTYCFVVKSSTTSGHHNLGGYATATDKSVSDELDTTPGTVRNTADRKTIIIATSTTALFVLCTLMLCVVTATCRRYRRRKQRHYHQLNDHENDEISNHDPIQVGPRDGAESVYSDSTDLARLKPFAVQRFLEDQTVPAAGIEEDQQSLDDSFSHTDEGMEEEEEEMERGSVQGSGDLDSSQSSTGSLLEQHRLRLNQIKKDNENRGSEAIELSPLRAVSSPKTTPPLSVRSTALGVAQHSPSLVAHFPKSYQREAVLNGYLQESPPPTGNKGDAPQNGYLPHTRTEGFHNPACTSVAPVTERAAGGKTPPMPARQTSSTNGDAALRSHVTQGHPSPGPQQRQAVAVLVGGASSMSSTDKGQSATGSNTGGHKLELVNNGFTNSGYVQSPFGDDFVPSASQHPSAPAASTYIQDPSTSSTGRNIHHPPVSSNVSDPSTGGNIHHPPTPSDNGYVYDPSVLSTVGNVHHPPIPSTTGYIDNLPTSIDLRERDSRSRSAESGNEDDSTSNEGDAGSVFDDDVMPNLTDHIGRSRSTVTSGFQSGSSESASPEPPIKSLSNSPPPSPPTLSHHSHTQSTLSTGTRSGLAYPLDPSRDGHFPLPLSHTYDSSQTSSFGTYRPSSYGSSSGYVTDSSLQSSYLGSSAVSQTSKGTTDDLEREKELSELNYTFIPSIHGPSNSSSPVLPHVNVSQSSTEVCPPSRNTLPPTHIFPLYDAHSTAPAITDYYNTRDVDLSTIMFDPHTEGDTSDNVHPEVSFEIPVFSS